MTENPRSSTAGETLGPTAGISTYSYALLDKFGSIDSIYESYRPTIKSAVQLLKADSENQQSKRCIKMAYMQS